MAWHVLEEDDGRCAGYRRWHPKIHIDQKSREGGGFARGALRKFGAKRAPNLRKIAGFSCFLRESSGGNG